MDDESVGIVEGIVEILAALLAHLYNLALHVFRHLLHGSHGCAAATHNHHVLHIYIMFLAHNLADVGNVVAGGHEVGEVVEFQLVVTARDDGIAASLDGYHMVGVVRTADVLERFVENLAALTQFDAEHHECSVVYIPALAHPTHLQSVVDIHGSQHFRVNQFADAQFPEELLCLRFHVLGVIHTCHGALGTQVLGKDACRDVHAFDGSDGDEQVGVGNSGISQSTQTGRLAQHGEQVAV